MAVGGKKQEVKKGFDKYTGFFLGKTVLINPTKEKFNKLLGNEGAEDDKEIEYIGEKTDEDGNSVRWARVTAWLSVEGESFFLPYSIQIRDAIRMNNDKTKVQLINCVGDTQWAEIFDGGDSDSDNNKKHVYIDDTVYFDISKVFDNFLQFQKVTKWNTANGKWAVGAVAEEVEVLGKKEYRPALWGEEDLLQFMKSWLNTINYYDAEATLFIDTKKLFAGNFKELSSLINSEYDSRNIKGELVPTGFTALAYVSTDANDPSKQYQKVWKEFLPAEYMKGVRNFCKFVKADQKKWNKYVDSIQSQYGVNGAYVLQPLKVYNPEEDIATQTVTKKEIPAPVNSSVGGSGSNSSDLPF